MSSTKNLLSFTDYYLKAIRFALNDAWAFWRAQVIFSVLAALLTLYLQWRWGMIPREFSNKAFLTVALPYAWIIIAALIFHALRAPHALDKKREKAIEAVEAEAASLRERLSRESSTWLEEKAKLETESEERQREARSESSHREAAQVRANRLEADLYEMRDQLKQEKSDHTADVLRLQAHTEKLYRNYREKHLSQMKEISELQGKFFAERSKNAKPNIYGEIKEIYFKGTSNGLYITLRVLIGNTGSATTLQPFKLRFSLNGREHNAREENVTRYSVFRHIDRPLWPSFTKEDEWEELTDLSKDNLEPLEPFRYREGWLRFRIPKLVSYIRHEGGELTLEIIDATSKVIPLTACPPWPQTGVIRLTSELEAEIDEAVERTRQKRAEEADQ